MPTRTAHQCHDGPVNVITALGDGQTLISGGSDGEIFRHEPGGHPQSITSIGSALSAIEPSRGDDTLLIGYEDGGLKAISINDGGITSCPKFHTGLVSTIANIPTSSRVLTVSYDGTIGVWSTDSWQLQEKLVHGALAPIVSSTVDPAGDWFATSGVDSPIRIWKTDTYAVMTTLGSDSETVVDMVATPDSQRLLGLNYEGEVEVWGTELWQKEGGFETGNRGEGQLAMHPNGEYIAVGEEAGVSIFTTDGEIATHFDVSSGRAASVHFTTDGTTLGVGCEDGRVILLELQL